MCQSWVAIGGSESSTPPPSPPPKFPAWIRKVDLHKFKSAKFHIRSWIYFFYQRGGGIGWCQRCQIRPFKTIPSSDFNIPSINHKYLYTFEVLCCQSPTDAHLLTKRIIITPHIFINVNFSYVPNCISDFVSLVCFFFFLLLHAPFFICKIKIFNVSRSRTSSTETAKTNVHWNIEQWTDE